jgi:hypothetical protein
VLFIHEVLPVEHVAPRPIHVVVGDAAPFTGAVLDTGQELPCVGRSILPFILTVALGFTVLVLTYVLVAIVEEVRTVPVS